MFLGKVHDVALNDLIAQAFPFKIQLVGKQVWHAQVESYVCSYAKAIRGAVYQLEFCLFQVLIEPFGFLRLDPFISIGRVKRYCALRFFGGRIWVYLRAGGAVLPDV